LLASVSEVVGLLGKGKGAKFASIVYRTKKTKELARHIGILHADTRVLYEKDLVALNELLPTLTEPLSIEACHALIDSREESLMLGVGNNTKYTCADTYVHTDGIEGVRVHKETGHLYVSILSQEKTILEAGEPQKPVNSKPLTIAKRKIESKLPSARFRLFCIERIKMLKANGEVLEIIADES
jgi:hypothetical protein